MKNLIYKLSVFIMAIVLVTSCEENEIPQIDTNGAPLVQFANTSAVLATPEEGATTQVEVVLSTLSTSDRVINVEIDTTSTATADQVTIGDIVVPANSYVGTLDISGNFDALPESGSTKLVLNITGVDGNTDVLLDNSTLDIEFFRRCSISLEDLVGTWTGTDILGYPTEFTTYIEDGELMMTGGLVYGWLEDFWGEPIVDEAPVKLEVDLETFEVTIPEQYYVTTTYEGEVQPDYNLKGSGEIVNSCDKIMEISPVLVQPGGAETLDGSAYGDAFFVSVQMTASEEEI